MKQKIAFHSKLAGLRLNYPKSDGSVGLSLREAARLISQNGYDIKHAGYARWEKAGANLPGRTAIEAICRAFSVDTEQLFEEFRAPKKYKVSSQRFEWIVSKMPLLSDEEFDVVMALVDTLVARSRSGQTPARVPAD
jgi:transcriptional regulator with XRE-family HTH domain